jgi:hypothetical protein
MAFIAISLGVVWINRMCNPANPAFTMSEILRRQADAWVRGPHVFEADMSVVSDVACLVSLSEGWRKPTEAARSRPQPSYALTSFGGQPPLLRSAGWWSRSGSNRRPEACKATALPTELRPRFKEIKPGWRKPTEAARSRPQSSFALRASEDNLRCCAA